MLPLINTATRQHFYTNMGINLWHSFNNELVACGLSLADSDIAGRQRLRSAYRRQLDVPRYQRTTLGRRAFSVAEPTVWNSLPDELRDETENTFRQSLKTLLFTQY